MDVNENLSMPIIIIIGLRRSGTTAFWKAFRKNTRLCCYDEPFNPNLVELPEENSKGTRKEFIELYKTLPESFRETFSPVSIVEETSPVVELDQERYLRWLLNNYQQKDGVVIDSVRLNFKLEQLYLNFPNTILVHLYRNPVAWISSHMLPSGQGTWRKPLVNVYRKLSFWSRCGFYNNWGYQEIIEREILHNAYWAKAGIKASNLKKRPAIFKLASFWRWSFNEVEEQGEKLWGNRFISIQFENFCKNPIPIMSEIYQTAGLEKPKLDYSYIRSANRGFKPNCQRWDLVCNEI